jgi:hypothetical protein
MPSRRTFLAGAAGLGGLGALGVGAAAVSLGPVRSWSPAPDTWPLCRYGPAGTATTPDVTVPTDPVVDWEARPVGDGPVPGLVVGPEAVYASADGTAALDRSDGGQRWVDPATGGPIAVRDGTVLVAPGDVGSGERLRAFDGASGDRRWAVEPVARAVGLVPAGGTVYVAHGSGMSAYGAASGTRRWSATALRYSEPVPVVAGGRLYACTDPVVRFGTRSALDGLTRSPPAPEWEAGGPDTTTGAAAAAGSLVTAGHDRADRDDDRLRRGRLRRLDVTDGGRTWDVTVDPQGDGSLIGALAVAGERCLTGERRGESAAVVSRRLADGSVAWRRPVEGSVEDLAVAGDTVLAATGGDRVRAFALADGTERWGLRVWESRRIAPVDGTVFALTREGRVVALRERRRARR